MNVFATVSNGQPDGAYLPVFRDLASHDRFKTHHLTDDPSRADVILFLDVNEHAADWKLSKIRVHTLTQAFRDKVFVYNELDQPWCAVQGLYASMPRNGFDRRRQRACAYLLQDFNPFIQSARREAVEPDLLYSFVGRRCHSVREKVLKLPCSRAMLVDTSEANFFGQDAAGMRDRQQEYARTLCRSKFVLCPRGSGTSSFRLFETMAAGRVPVIISDQWVPPEGPRWNDFSISVPESSMEAIPQILKEAEDRAAKMGAEARRQWEAWYAPDVLFHHMVEACLSIKNSRRMPESLAARLPSRRFWRLRIRHAKSWLVKSLSRRRAISHSEPA
jgi:hypothetical protein